jgi:hypothetical protein
LIGLLVADQPLNLLFLLSGQLPAGSRRPTALANTDTLGPAALVQLAPAVNRARVHIENRCNLLNAVAFLPQLNGLLSQLLLDFGLECAGINFFSF